MIYKATCYFEPPHAQQGLNEVGRVILTREAESPEAFCQAIRAEYPPSLTISFGPVGVAAPIRVRGRG